MIKLFGNEITMTRGDTVRLGLTLLNMDNTEYELQEGDKVYFTVKSGDRERISREVSEGIILYPADTAILEYGKYDYDVEVVRANGDVNTVIVSKLIICKEVRE